MRIATAIAGALATAAAAMAVMAFASGDGEPATRTRTTAAPQVDPGLAVWAQNGCGSCHALAAADASGRFGPDLGVSLRGQTAAAIQRSIVDPGASAAPGTSAGMMPAGSGDRIPPADLARLVRFLRRSASG